MTEADIPHPEEPHLDDACRCGHTFGYHCTPEFPNGGYCAATDAASPGYGCNCQAFKPAVTDIPLRDAIELTMRGHISVKMDDGRVMCLCRDLDSDEHKTIVFDGPVFHRQHVAEVLLREFDIQLRSPHPNEEP